MISSLQIVPTHQPFQSAFIEVLGDQNELRGINRDQCASTVYINELCRYMNEKFNTACACGLAQQIGRSAFTHMIRSTAGPENLMGQSFRLLPARQRLMHGLEQLASLIESVFDIPIETIDTADSFRLATTGYQPAHALIPYLETGFIQEFVQWASGGKPHSVNVEMEGHSWSILIGKQPLDI